MSSFQSTDFHINNYLFKDIDSYKIEDIYTLNNYPVVYIIYDTNTLEAYVGESTNALKRMQNHLSNPDKSKLKYLFIISSSYFNKSATLDIESSLIQSMVADDKFSLLNGNAGIVDHKYYQKSDYQQLFLNIWEKLRFEKVVTKDILEINNSDLYKYSPYKSLTTDQHTAVYTYLSILLNRTESTVFVEGAAGTGKTILAVYLIKLLLTNVDLEEYEDIEIESLKELELVKEIQEIKKDLQIAMVVPMVSLRKTLKKVFKNVKGLKPSMVISPSEVTKRDYDILIVDEAHRLRRRFGITNYKSHDDNNRLLGLDNEGTELDWIMRSSKHQLFFYDPAQSIRPSDVEKEVFDKIKADPFTKSLELTSQLRAKGGVDYIRFVNLLLDNKLDATTSIFKVESYELMIFRDITRMIDKLKEKEKLFGLSRLMAGYGWEWKSKKANVPDAVIDGVELTWNRVPHDWINSTDDLCEMGCIHTVQGYDLNYAGVIFGNEIKYDKEKGEIIVSKECYFDSKGSVGIQDIEVLKRYIINIYKTMMLRGIRGTFIYVMNDELREYMSNYIPTD